MQQEYNNIIPALGQVMTAENAFNASAGIKDKIYNIKILKKKIIVWLKQLPVVGFNSGNYDLNFLEKNLIPILLKANKDLAPIKRGNCFLAMSTPELAFLDLNYYLAPNYSLALFLEHYDATETKGSFPCKKVRGCRFI